MPKITKGRIPIRIDMTPMVDIAFLLLTFFMLTTQFKPPEEFQVILPSSHSAFKLPESDVMTVAIDKESRIFLGVDSKPVRQRVFTQLIADNWEQYPAEIRHLYGTPENLAVLAPSHQVTVEQLRNLIVQARIANPRLRTVIKGDRDAEYGVTEDVMDILQKAQITRFNLVTDLEYD